MATATREVVGRSVVVVAAVVCVIAFVVAVASMIAVVGNRTEPDSATGRTIAWSYHGTFYYITPLHRRVILSAMVVFGCGFVALAVGIYLKRMT